ncbi:vesicular-fusion protein SEC17 [Hysterangium stoloniferum]|nr:vesicular-fusion protein SEC17 [Hysterangium stoloniferum]
MAPKSPADGLLDKANKKLDAAAKGGWLSFGSSSSSKFEEAGDLYQQAANQFKLDKNFKSAGDSFSKEAECREKGGETSEAANAWWNAAKAYKQGFPDLAIQALTQTITYLTKAGRFRQAADREKEMGQIYLQETNNLPKACESYERAAEWYAQEDAHATANACYKDAADLHAELDEFSQAIKGYERVADHSLNSSLTKYSVKEYWLRAGLCALAMRDPITAKRNLGQYSTKDVTFPTTREAKFVNSLIDAIEKGDLAAYTAAVVEFDQVMRLDNWKTSILLKIKKTIDEDDPLT